MRKEADVAKIETRFVNLIEVMRSSKGLSVETNHRSKFEGGTSKNSKQSDNHSCFTFGDMQTCHTIGTN